MFDSRSALRGEDSSLENAKMNVLAGLIFAKVSEQVDLLGDMIRRLPPGKSRWTPELPLASFPQPRCLGEVLGHLLQCLAGFVAVLYAVHPAQLEHFLELKKRTINHLCAEDEALERIAEYRRCLREGFQLLQDDELARTMPTVFVPEGEAVLTLLLGNLEHLINHKHELFFYVKLLGVPLTSADLYLFRTQLSQSQKAAPAQH